MQREVKDRCVVSVHIEDRPDPTGCHECTSHIVSLDPQLDTRCASGIGQHGSNPTAEPRMGIGRAYSSVGAKVTR
jgi:hypothetical protein